MKMPISDVLANNVPRDVDHGIFPQVAVSTAGKQTAILQLPPSWDFWYFLITDLNANLTAVMVQEIRVKAKNKPIWTIDGVSLRDMHRFDKANGSLLTSQIFLPMGRMGVLGGANLVNFPSARFISGASKDMALLSTLNCGSLGPNGEIIDQVSIEIDLVNTPAGPIALHCMSIATPPAPGGPGLIRRVEKKTWQAALGENVMTRQNFSIGDDQHRFLTRLQWVTAGGALSNWRVRYNNNDKLLRGTVTENATLQQLFNAKAGDTGDFFYTDFCERGYGDEAPFIGDAGTDFQVTFDDSAAEAITVYQDSIGLL